MSKALKERWEGRTTPFNKYICRKCAPEMFPDEALAEYPVDSYHVGDRFITFKMFAVYWDITLNGKPLVAPVREVRGSDDGTAEGWVIINVPTGVTPEGNWMAQVCSCARAAKEDRQAERLIYGRVTMRTKTNPAPFSLS